MFVDVLEERRLVRALEPLAGELVTNLLDLRGTAEVPGRRRRRGFLRSELEDPLLRELALVPFFLAVGQEGAHELVGLVGSEVFGRRARDLYPRRGSGKRGASLSDLDFTNALRSVRGEVPLADLAPTSLDRAKKVDLSVPDTRVTDKEAAKIIQGKTAGYVTPEEARRTAMLKENEELRAELLRQAEER
jgi:hypothetical protein